MSAVYEIPLQVGVPQSFQASLGGIVYTLTLQYRDDPGGEGGWTLDIADSNGVAIVSGTPLVTGANLLEQYGYLNIGNGGGLYVQTSSDPDAVPTFSNIGDDGLLYWVTA